VCMMSSPLEPGKKVPSYEIIRVNVLHAVRFVLASEHFVFA